MSLKISKYGGVKMKLKRILALLIFIFLVTGVAVATGSGATWANSMKIAQGARQIGMGEASVGLADDVNAMFWNPAGLAFIAGQQFSLMHSSWLMDINSEYVAYSINLEKIAAFGIYANYMNFGEITQTLENPVEEYILTSDKAAASTLNLALAVSKKISDFVGPYSGLSDLAVGLRIVNIAEKIYSDEGSGNAFTASLLYQPKFVDHSFGLTIENFGLSVNRGALPLAVKLGFGYVSSSDDIVDSFSDESFIKNNKKNLALGLDVAFYPIDNVTKINLGVEKGWYFNDNNILTLRGGVQLGYDMQLIGRWSAGAGYKIVTGKDMAFSVDYAIADFVDLGLTHRFSLTGSFAPLVTQTHRDIPDLKSAIAHYTNGVSLLRKNKTEAAKSEFREAIRRNRKFEWAYIGMALCNKKAGNAIIMQLYFDKAIEVSTDKNIKAIKDYVGKNGGLPHN